MSQGMAVSNYKADEKEAGDIPVSLTGTDGSFEDAMTAIAHHRRRES